VERPAPPDHTDGASQAKQIRFGGRIDLHPDGSHLFGTIGQSSSPSPRLWFLDDVELPKMKGLGARKQLVRIGPGYEHPQLESGGNSWSSVMCRVKDVDLAAIATAPFIELHYIGDLFGSLLSGGIALAAFGHGPPPWAVLKLASATPLNAASYHLRNWYAHEQKKEV
jgi:hypothetical protein